MRGSGLRVSSWASRFRANGSAGRLGQQFSSDIYIHIYIDVYVDDIYIHICIYIHTHAAPHISVAVLLGLSHLSKALGLGDGVLGSFSGLWSTILYSEPQKVGTSI